MRYLSKNKKLNFVLNDTYDRLLDIKYDVPRYRKEFPKETDYNLYAYGNLIIATYDIQQLFIKAGYVGSEKWNNDKVIKAYKSVVGQCARIFIEREFKKA